MQYPPIPNMRRCSLLVTGDKASNPLDFMISVIGQSVINSSLPGVLILADAPSDGKDLVDRLNGSITNMLAKKENGPAQARLKAKSIRYRYNLMADRPTKVRSNLMEHEVATAPWWIIRDDSSQSQAGLIPLWADYAKEIISSIAATCVHIVKTGPMGEMPVDPSEYSVWWEAKDYAPPYRERVNNAIVLEDHSAGKKQIWRDRPVSGGAAIWFPALDEVLHV